MDSNNILQEQIKNLPTELKSFLSEESWLPITEQLSIENSLSPEQKLALENEVAFVLVGFELSSNFKKNIRANLGVTEIQAENIAQKIDSYVFENVRKFLPTAEEMGPEPEAEEKQPPQAAKIPSISMEASKDIFVPRSPVMTSQPSPAIPKETHLATVPGQTAHEAEKVNRQPTTDNRQQFNRPIEEKGQAQTKPTSSYPSGIDPYREPLV